MRRAGAQRAPKFFNAHEWATVAMLVDYIIPRDERSGSATDAKVPEYMDFLLAEKDANVNTQIAMHGGLGVARHRVSQAISENVHRGDRRAAARGARRHRVSAEGEAGDELRRQRSSIASAT